MSSVSHQGFTHLGLDVSKDWIAVAALAPDRDRATVQKIFHDEVSVRRLIGRFDDRSKLWACYEAGPTGYDLYRLLVGMGVRCDVIAPSLIPKRRGDRVKTDKRDARHLAGLHRAGQLTPIGVPSPAQEAVRDLCRTRGDMVEDLTRARNRSRSSCCVTRWCGATDPTGRSSISDGWPVCVSMIRRSRQRSRTTAPPSSCATTASPPSKRTSRPLATVHPSATRSITSPPTGA